MNKAIAALLATAALCGANLAHAQTTTPLTGAARNSFIQSAVKTCAPGLQNFGLSADKVEQICNCYANAVADNINCSEALALTVGLAPQGQTGATRLRKAGSGPKSARRHAFAVHPAHGSRRLARSHEQTG